ncbi:LysR family transcriptional regulator [Massilia sp. CF038]|uniref:LysR family transcriptional regulator n=1 Tax=Massilia sp. CF038 TaxID=1881045 RepID=UPI000923D64F|nr:LysR family transcriptional regulator [Massilia sp. CF038]SHG61703.1 transcriptional regulator, LysR family [Massilia sp. CF038]
MIDNVLDLAVFARVVSAGSMSAAARELDLSLAVVSKRIALLEERVGVRLIHRTTRRQSLTQEGQQFHAHCVQILARVSEAEAAMTHSRTEVAGLLRLSAPRAFGRHHLAPLVAAFREAHPAVSVEMILDDEVVDIVDAGIDVALRFGALEDSTMIARYIGPNYRLLTASPDYVRRHGAPASLEQLQEHACIVYSARAPRHWLFQHEGKAHEARIKPVFICNDGDAAQELALAGAGILYRSIFDVADALASGKLVKLLAHYTTPTEPLHLVYPHALHLAPRVRAFADFAVVRLRTIWTW